MKTPDWFQDSLMAAVDSAMAYVPRPYVPNADSVARAKIIAHRGAHKPPFGSGGEILENTMQAFQRAVDTGSWGLELDLRWTSDDVPVVHHDRDCGRLFKKSITIHRVTQKKLRESVEHIPTLEEFVNAFKGKAHFMIEIKKGRGQFGAGGKFWTQKKIDILAGHLSGLAPQRDYHLISLKPKLLLDCKFAPREAMVSVAEWNTQSMSEFALKHGFGGFAGHYLLLTNAIIQRHLKAGQKVGSGFPTSRSVLVRELNRGIEWIFTNHAPQIAEELRSLRPT